MWLRYWKTELTIIWLLMKLRNRLKQKVKCCSETDVQIQLQFQKCEKHTNTETLCRFNSLKVCEFKWRRNEKLATIQEWDQNIVNAKNYDEWEATSYTPVYELTSHRDDRIVVARCCIVEHNKMIYILQMHRWRNSNLWKKSDTSNHCEKQNLFKHLTIEQLKFRDMLQRKTKTDDETLLSRKLLRLH